MAKLNSFVAVRDADGHDVWFGPGQEVPGWAIAKITNPAAWAEAPKVDPVQVETEAEQPLVIDKPPARRGRKPAAAVEA